MSKRYKSELLESIHQSAQALFRVGAIDKATLNDFDAACLAPPPSPEAATHPIGTRLIQEGAKIALEDTDVVLPSRHDDLSR